MSVDIPRLIRSTQIRWADTYITPSRVKEVTETAQRLVAPKAKAMYVSVSKITTVPWWVIAVIHEREASQAWWANIAQGDPWNVVSRHVPKGRGPFKSWTEAAVDALTRTPLFTLRRVSDWHDWSAGGTLTLLEMYNGFGYETIHHEASPYIWAATNHQEMGKYIRDGVWSATVWDQQLGCAAMLKRMQELDESIIMNGKGNEEAVAIAPLDSPDGPG